MPLRDHFHPPLHPIRSWESFHTWWATTIGEYLNRILPRRYAADIFRHLGAQVAADVVELERLSEPSEEWTNGPVTEGGLAVHTWAPPAATMVLPAVFPDDIEVRVTDQFDDARVVAVVELVSPSNKDRPDARRAFAAKCAAYLQRGIGLVVADIVTARHANLHNEFVDLLRLADDFRMAGDASLSAVAYRPASRQREEIDVWPQPLTLGGPLPVLPLALRGTRAVPLDLDWTYHDACRRARL